MGVSDLLLAWRSAHLGVAGVGRLQTALQYGPTYSLPSGVNAMTIQASYSNDLRPALACVNNRPERTVRSLERWMIHRPDGSLGVYLVNWGVRSTADLQPSTKRLPDLTDQDVMTALTFPGPANEGCRFLERSHE